MITTMITNIDIVTNIAPFLKDCTALNMTTKSLWYLNSEEKIARGLYDSGMTSNTDLILRHPDILGRVDMSYQNSVRLVGRIPKMDDVNDFVHGILQSPDVMTLACIERIIDAVLSNQSLSVTFRSALEALSDAAFMTYDLFEIDQLRKARSEHAKKYDGYLRYITMNYTTPKSCNANRGDRKTAHLVSCIGYQPICHAIAEREKDINEYMKAMRDVYRRFGPFSMMPLYPPGLSDKQHMEIAGYVD